MTLRVYCTFLISFFQFHGTPSKTAPHFSRKFNSNASWATIKTLTVLVSRKVASKIHISCFYVHTQILTFVKQCVRVCVSVCVCCIVGICGFSLFFLIFLFFCFCWSGYIDCIKERQIMMMIYSGWFMPLHENISVHLLICKSSLDKCALVFCCCKKIIDSYTDGIKN